MTLAPVTTLASRQTQPAHQTRPARQAPHTRAHGAPTAHHRASAVPASTQAPLRAPARAQTQLGTTTVTQPAAPATRSYPQPRPSTAVPATPPQPAPSEVRGFALYVGLDEASAAELGISLTEIVTELRELLQRRAPSAEHYASVALAPSGAPGKNLDLVRLALQEPKAVHAHQQASETERKKQADAEASSRVIIDTSRKRVLVDGENADFTFKEFELLQALVLREGRTVSREEIIEVLWKDSAEPQPHARTIDVHVRRLRNRLGDYADIVRTVRGKGYRFDRHADVRVIHSCAHLT
ncbi:winged helix-turn-helix domain-containing protein [Gulosibacter bifidus]|uniref:Winged helix-turn-helix domain-containing protein n=1 Tax=Gulosibacter bifidus TaxID=272239 RepID=A0ABW5RK77_9MICO|nr:winged helix-turn-helix domain-containing protein [Gulosibacter bifidus]